MTLAIHSESKIESKNGDSNGNCCFLISARDTYQRSTAWRRTESWRSRKEGENKSWAKTTGRGRETEENKRGRRNKKEGTRRIAEKVNILL